MSHFSRFLSTFRSAHPEFGPTGRQKSDIPPVFCLPSLEIQRGLRAKRRFLKFSRKCLPDFKDSVKPRGFKALISAQALYFLEASCKTRSHIQMKISRTTKSDRVALKAHANYLNERPNELRCSKEAADYEFKIRTIDSRNNI